ncbi:MAG: response regulator transcription factor [Alphaproteobacteria bacterium]|nr:response regulator transcription factor [Alphaproteobacteria bacterium]
MRILLVEDEDGIAKRVARALESSGYLVERSSDGEDAWFRGDTENFDAVILDLGLPQMDGIQVLKRWRAAGRNMPVLILTARGTWMERVEGIDAGADDYLPKPFQMEELKARLRALLRRSAGSGSPLIAIGPVSLDTRQMTVSVDDSAVDLSVLEFRILAYLMHHTGRVVSQLELTEHVYGEDIERDSNAIEVLIARVRKKLGVELIKTRRGYGYIIPDEVSAASDVGS